MIVDILKERKIQIKVRKNDGGDKQFDADFCMINLVVEDLINAKEGIQNIESLKKMFKNSNDPSESDKLYKQCQEEHTKTDKLIKKGKKMLGQEQKDLKGIYLYKLINKNLLKKLLKIKMEIQCLNLKFNSEKCV